VSYIGNNPVNQNFVAGADQFSGTGSQLAFTLSRNVNTVFDMFVTVSNVPQDPFTAYTVSGNTLTFDSAPPSGTNNIDVVYRATNVQTFVPSPRSVGLTQLSATGTPSASTFLRGDNTWAVVEGVPAGTAIFYAANTAPSGYLKANGANVSRTTYAALFAAIGTTFGAGDGSTTFTLPDMRGEFPRGWDDGRGVDSGRVFGSAQTDAMQGHRHQASTGLSRPFSAEVVSSLDAFYNTGSYTLSTGGPVANGGDGTPRTAAETRARNIALLACIKF
jgi:microcystin-dependent protein